MLHGWKDTFSLSVHPLTDNRVVSAFWLLLMILLWTHVRKYLSAEAHVSETTRRGNLAEGDQNQVNEALIWGTHWGEAAETPSYPDKSYFDVLL